MKTLNGNCDLPGCLPGGAGHLSSTQLGVLLIKPPRKSGATHKADLLQKGIVKAGIFLKNPVADSPLPLAKASDKQYWFTSHG